MASLNLSELIKGLINVTLIAMAVGHFGDLQKFAIREAFGVPRQPYGSIKKELSKYQSTAKRAKSSK